MSGKPIPAVRGSLFNERRNTSRVFAVPPHAYADATRALAALRRDQPALVRWLEDGHPTLTHDEHQARFGEPYRGVRSRRREAVSPAKGKEG